MVKVSIIVPVYNSERSLKRCLDSIVNQSHSNLEIIIVNDGSTDGSLEISNKYSKKEPRITVINQENSGVSTARNIGLSNSTGDYLMFVDSDDYLDINMVELLIENINLNNSDIVICGIKRHRNSKVEMVNFKNSGEFNVKDFLSNNASTIADNLIGSPCNKLYSTRVIKTNGLKFDTNIEYAEDLLFNFKYFKKINNVTVLDQHLYNYMLASGNSLSSKFREDCFANLTIIYIETLSILHFFDIDISKVRDYFANIYLSQIEHLYRKDSTLNNNQRIKLINEELIKSKTFNLINTAQLTNKNKIIWFLVTRKQFFILNLLLKIKQIVKFGIYLFRRK